MYKKMAVAWLVSSALFMSLGVNVSFAAPLSPQMQSRVQPANAVQDVSPIKLRLQNAGSAPRATRVNLGPLVQARASGGGVEGAGPLLIGTARVVPATTTFDGTQRQFLWQPTASGGQVAAISFTAQGAKGLRLGVLVRQLPGNAVLRVYNQSNPDEVFQISGHEVLQRIDANLSAGDNSEEAHTWWTLDLATGEESTLEIELPAGVPTQTLRIAIPRLSHTFVDLYTLSNGAGTSQDGEAQPCISGAFCYDSRPGDQVNAGHAVARMVFVKRGQGYLCTGTLLNSRGSVGIPYFLSANQCIPNQTVASTLQTDWFYRAASCTSSTLSAASTTRFGGATLLYASSATDTSFMRLNEAPPVGVVFAGWDATSLEYGGITLQPADVIWHHPKGGLLKQNASNFSREQRYNCTISEEAAVAICNEVAGQKGEGNFYRGISGAEIQRGSEGASLFYVSSRVVGTLVSSSPTCREDGGKDVFYARFEVPYKAALHQWLWPETEGSRTPVYRFYNGTTSAHFFTPNADERDYVVANYPGFAYEGIAFYVPAAQQLSTNPVFRFFNRESGAHFYTISGAERDYVAATLPSYQFEGQAWFGRTVAGSGASPVFRFYNGSRNVHFYTISQAERDFVLANNPDYHYEGPAYYAWTTNGWTDNAGTDDAWIDDHCSGEKYTCGGIEGGSEGMSYWSYW